MTDSVYLTIFLPRYVCEAPARRQIKSIYLHSAFSRLLTYWAPSGPRFPKLGKWGGLISWNGGGGQESPARSNSTSFGYLLNSLGKEFWKLARGWDRLGAGHNQPYCPFFFFRWEVFVLHRMVGRTQRGVLTPGCFEPCNFPSHMSQNTLFTFFQASKRWK